MYRCYACLIVVFLLLLCPYHAFAECIEDIAYNFAEQNFAGKFKIEQKTKLDLSNCSDFELISSKITSKNSFLLELKDLNNKKYSVNYNLKWILDVIVPVKDIQTGEIVTASHFTKSSILSNVQINKFLDDIDIESSKQYAAKKQLIANKPVLKSDVLEKAIITSGQIVTLRFQKGSLRIDTKGVAVDQGSIGQMIRVRNFDSNKILHGKIESNSIISIEGQQR